MLLSYSLLEPSDYAVIEVPETHHLLLSTREIKHCALPSGAHRELLLPKEGTHRLHSSAVITSACSFVKTKSHHNRVIFSLQAHIGDKLFLDLLSIIFPAL